MLRVRDIMTTDVFTIESTETIATAARALLAQFISGAPVVDDSGKLVGILSEADILRRVLDACQECVVSLGPAGHHIPRDGLEIVADGREQAAAEGGACSLQFAQGIVGEQHALQRR